jgi:hypothetical protein
VDGTLLVTDIARANKGDLERAKTILAQAGACVLGCVVNKEHQQRRHRGSFHGLLVGQRSEESRGTRESNAPSALLNPAMPMISMPQRMQPR